MRRVRYNVAASLGGFIDFGAQFARVDTVLLGRRSYELTLRDPAARPRGAADRPA